MLLGRYEAAVANYRTALAIEPDNPTVHANLATALVNRWQLEEALVHYQEAVRLNPKDIETRMNLASVQQMIRARRARSRQPQKQGQPNNNLQKGRINE